MRAFQMEKKGRGLVIFPSGQKWSPFINPARARHVPTLCVSFLRRAGYLTLFGGEQNNNGTDPSSVYEEYKKFDGLLTKMARGTLKPGSDTENTLNCFKTLYVSSEASVREPAVIWRRCDEMNEISYDVCQMWVIGITSHYKP